MLLEQQKLLDAYARLVAEWGKKMNLVSEPNIEAIMREHVNDCVSAFDSLAKNSTAALSLPLVDIGSGAGFPGIVWK